jgi:hypothetical protein
MLNMTIPVREVPTTALRNHQQRMQGRFLKGPIPLPDIAEAAKLPGQALGVFLAIHHRAALTGSKSVTLPRSLLEQFGVSRDSKARSLRLLEKSSLVAVERSRGRTARITLRPLAQHTSTGG